MTTFHYWVRRDSWWQFIAEQVRHHLSLAEFVQAATLFGEKVSVS